MQQEKEANNSRKKILITGAAKRLGKVLAQYFANRDYDIAIHYNSSEEEARIVRDKIKSEYNVSCDIFQANLDNLEECKGLISRVKSEFGNIDILINNASIFKESKFLETDEDLFDEHFNVNFKAPFFLSKLFKENFESGSIYNIIDSNTHKNADLFFTYMLTKKLLRDFTEMAAKVLGPEIRVNGISPGVLMPSLNMNAEDIARQEATYPLRKHAKPSDIAEAILMLEDHGHITGQIIKVDGGSSLCF
jgi:pteridine reductase